MIPLKLQLKNFLSYGPDLQMIDFSAYSLICLSGNNGHGKSALLDAITWALWGQARKIGGAIKSDESLVRIGETQMTVIFDFICNNQTYRIRREYMKTYGKPVVALDFGILNQETDSFAPLSDKTVRTTQAAIEQTLHLDFDSFINSAFLRQGQANEFSKKSPKERKEILGTILGLNRFETIRKLATEKVRDATNQKATVITVQEKIDEELKTTATINEQLTTITQQLSELGKQEKEIRNKQEIMQSKRKNLLEDEHKVQLLIFKFDQLTQHEQSSQQRLLQCRTAWKAAHKKQLTLPDIHQLEKQKKIF